VKPQGNHYEHGPQASIRAATDFRALLTARESPTMTKPLHKHATPVPVPLSPSIAELAAVELLVLDVDGVMTDGGVYYRDDGQPLLRFSINDGLGVVLLQRAGVPVAVLSSGSNPLLNARIERLGIKYFRPAVMRKGEALVELCAQLGVATEHVAYVGDDVNDAAAMSIAGVPITVANAQQDILRFAKYITASRGGHGAVREVCNILMWAKGFDPVALWEQGGGAS
jgi:3-deoxy-D-manno-octulosonate 8-phosphate phosphatase (KDO 8-P phosphatase)